MLSWRTHILWMNRFSSHFIGSVSFECDLVGVVYIIILQLLLIQTRCNKQLFEIIIFIDIDDQSLLCIILRHNGWIKCFCWSQFEFECSFNYLIRENGKKMHDMEMTVISLYKYKCKNMSTLLIFSLLFFFI